MVNKVKEEEINYLTFIAEEDGAQFGYAIVDNGDYDKYYDINYSIDEGNSWIHLEQEELTIPINTGESIVWKGTALASIRMVCGLPGSCLRFVSTHKFKAKGSIQESFFKKLEFKGFSLEFKNMMLGNEPYINVVESCLLLNGYVNEQAYAEEYASVDLGEIPQSVMEDAILFTMFLTSNSNSLCRSFYGMFRDTKITSCEDLVLCGGIDMLYMFDNCVYLTKTPLQIKLFGMEDLDYTFNNCSNLTIAPRLEGKFFGATTYRMFANCPIEYIEVYILYEHGRLNLVGNMPKNGVIETNVDPALFEGIPDGWTVKLIIE